MTEIIHELEQLMVRQQSLEYQYQQLRQLAGELYNESSALGAQLGVLMAQLIEMRKREAGEEWRGDSPDARH